MLKKGFTLIELLVVIAIIGILAAMVLVSLSSARNKAKDASVESDVRNIMSGVELYINENNITEAVEAALASGAGLGADLITEGLISTVPIHPNRRTAGSNDTTDGYAVTVGVNNTYLIWGLLSDGEYFYAKNGTTTKTTDATKPTL